MVRRMFEEELIENTKAYLISTPKPRQMAVEDYVARVETLNNYMAFMDIGATKFTEREIIRSVIMQKIPGGWRSSLLRAGNNNATSIESLLTKLVPIETTDNEEQKRRNKPNNHDNRKPRWNQKDQNGNNGRGGKPWHHNKNNDKDKNKDTGKNQEKTSRLEPEMKVAIHLRTGKKREKAT